jgi:hypothetical protein
VSIRYKYAGLNPVVTGKPTSPERPSNKPSPGSYDDRAPPVDPVNHPPHYTAGGIETIDAIEAALTAEEFRGYCKGNALKYVWREKHKGQNESLRKAIWYLNRLVGGVP